MTTFDTVSLIAVIFTFYIGFGLYLGYSMDDQKKDPITAFFDGYLIVLPMICMIALGAPLVMAGFSALVTIYSVLKWFIDGVSIHEEAQPFVAYFGYCVIACFWWFFRERVLKYKSII